MLRIVAMNGEDRVRDLLFLFFGNSKAVADFDTKAVSKIDQKWRILTRRRSVKSISWNASGSAEGPKQQPSLNNHVNL